MTKHTTAYDESAIKILEGLEPVKMRPGMYTRTVDPLHIIQEVLDNAVDEALGGFANRIDVGLLPGGTVLVRDNGRGIPVGLHPEKKIPVVQAVFCILHAGGKFDKGAGGAYSFSGGLHGVGVSVTNALSKSLEVRVTRDGWQHEIAFADGDVVRPLKRLGRAEGSGTELRITPNPKYFDSPDVPVAQLRELLRSKAVLLPGIEVVLRDERNPEAPKEEVFRYADGLPSYLAELAQEPALVDVIAGSAFCGPEEETFAEGEGAQWAFSWFEGGDGSGRSFVNLIPTPLHGTHVAGLRAAVFSVVKAYIEHHSMLPKGLKLTADDAFKQVRFVLSARILDPAFENQTKDRLSSRDSVRLIERTMLPSLEAWFNHNPAQAKTVAELVIRQALARQRSTAKVERKRSSSVVMLPGKLADCESEDIAVNELFLVEGDSAGGSAKQGRSKDTQAIFPMRGKSLNVWEKTKEEALSNEEIADVATAIGVSPHGPNDEVDLSKLRYGKVCILSDADVDGFHIQVLLLTLFYRHFPRLVERGHVYVARPPLYRIDADAAGKKRQARKIYAMDEAELANWEERLKKEGYVNWRVGRFKGLGEMDPAELWETTLAPDTRRLLKVTLPDEFKADGPVLFDNLMGKSRAAWRKEWMERRGHEVDAF